MKLYSFFASSASFRVRIALNLKALDYDTVPIQLRKDGGQNLTPEYVNINPQGLVPTLIDEGSNIPQSIAIIEYLEEKYPDIPVLPEKPEDRAIVRAMALAIACDVHPLNNSGVLRYLRQEMQQSEKAISRWYEHWIQRRFNGLEQMVDNYGGTYCYGDTITLADICLIPQIYNAKKFNCDINDYTKLLKIYDTLILHPAFEAARPESQADYEK